MLRPLALIVDCETTPRPELVATVRCAGCRVHSVAVLDSLPEQASRLRPAVAIAAFPIADIERVAAVLDRLQTAQASVVIAVLAIDATDVMLAALRRRLSPYEVLGPAELGRLTSILEGCVERARHAPAADDPRGRASAPPNLIGETGAMRGVGKYLVRVAQTDATVLITGDTGTGKEMAATLIHAQSRRAVNRFVSINCAAIPDSLIESELFGHESGAFTGAVRASDGLLQQANHGTVFLDEIGEMGLQAQAKILRAIETREVRRLGARQPERLDIRIVAATNQDPERAVEDGRLRKDLYFRLNVARVHLPPLRERRSDIVLLLDHYLTAMGHRHKSGAAAFADDALEALQAYDWPGNVRELKNLVEAILVCPPHGCISLEDLPEHFRRKLAAVCRLPGDERRRLLEALVTARWNKSKAAQLLHWSRMTLYRKMARHAVVCSDPPDGRTVRTAGSANRRRAS